MGSSLIPTELRLLSSNTIGRFVSKISKRIEVSSSSDKVSVLDDFVTKLQDEMKKIDAFKRELPLCVDLLDEAIVVFKEELTQCKRSNPNPNPVVPVLEEFMPLKNGTTSDEKDEKIMKTKENDDTNNNKNKSDKMNWLRLSSVQLGNLDNQHRYRNTEFALSLDLDKDFKKRIHEEIKRPKIDSLFQIGGEENRGRAIGKGFLPPLKRRVDEFAEVPRLSLCTPEIKNPVSEIQSSKSSSSSSRSGSGSSFKDARKQRRCWSTELHRRFISALQDLGGAQAATPKQIREHMKVDGLTNDEVKSHLQKYRLHARRTITATKTSSIQPVVLDRLWPASQEQCSESPKRSISQSGSPQCPLNLAGSSQGTSMTGADSMDDEDDEKSESHDWKSEIRLRP